MRNRIWDESGPVLRATIIISPIAGCLTFALSAWGDATGFWSDKPFLTNMVSALAGAFFGIPFALVVLQRLAMDQANRVERAGAQRLAVRTGQELWAVTVAATGADNTGSPPSAYQAIDRRVEFNPGRSIKIQSASRSCPSAVGVLHRHRTGESARGGLYVDRSRPRGELLSAPRCTDGN